MQNDVQQLSAQLAIAYRTKTLMDPEAGEAGKPQMSACDPYCLTRQLKWAADGTKMS